MKQHAGRTRVWALLAVLLIAQSADLRFSALTAGARGGSGHRSQGVDLEAKIHRVENGLLPAIVVKGQPAPRMGLSERMRFFNTPGVSIAVIHNGKVEWARGYGVREAGRSDPVSPATLFQAASISKPVAAVAALRLVEQGKLTLDEDVNLKLASWKVPENQFTSERKVTLRGLLSHGAGLTVHGFRGYASGEEVPTLLQALDGAKPANSQPVRVDTTPGFIWRYAGGGYNVLQQLLTDVTGKPFPQLMRETVLTIVGMDNSSYEQPLPQNLSAQAATGHRGNGEAIGGGWHTYPEMAAAGLWTTPTDLARFAVELQKAKGGQSRKVLSPRMASQMLTEQIGNWGLGVELDGKEQAALFRHGGANEGFRCVMVAYTTNGEGAVVMTNSDRGGALAGEILRSIATEYGWPSYLPVEKVLARVDPVLYASYAGRYELAPSVVLRISAEEGKLMQQVAGQPKSELFPESDTRFFLKETDVQVTFVKDESGQVTHVIIRQSGQEIIARKTN